VDFKIIVMVVSLVWFLSEVILAFLKRSTAADARLDKSSLRILWTVIILSIFSGVFLGTRRPGHFGGESAWMPLAGLALIAAGLIVRWIAILSLRRQFTVDVAITRDHRLIKGGIYRSVRHPSYTGSLISFFGLGLCCASYLSLLVVFVPIFSAFLYRVRIEEKALTGAFGQEYVDYCASTKRFIPGVI
jgi:protein-S-isoprenylcysteine O-methyltransferase Ste14